MKYILYIALAISVATFSFWDLFPKGSFYIGNAIVFFLIGLYLYLKNTNSFICFLFLAYSINNLCDELWFEPCVFGINEKVFALVTPLIWFYKKYCNGRKIL